jgi:hypothetical protein
LRSSFWNRRTLPTKPTINGTDTTVRPTEFELVGGPFIVMDGGPGGRGADRNVDEPEYELAVPIPQLPRPWWKRIFVSTL